jgi:hypothetical protein
VTLRQEFKSGCIALREQILGARTPLIADGRVVDAAYIAQYWPGGSLNERKDVKGWANCYGVLKGLCRLFDKSQQPADRAAKRAAVLEAIAETPEVVELVGTREDGTQRTLTVYQKGDVALRKVHGLNIQLAQMVDDYAVIAKHGGPDATEALTGCLEMQSYLQRCIVWIATTPGPRAPFADAVRWPDLPPELDDLHGLDFYSLAQAFQRVNVAGFAALESATTPRTRPDWSVFWSGAEEVTGSPAPVLMLDRGLLSLVATCSERARGTEEAHKRAESERKRAG